MQRFRAVLRFDRDALHTSGVILACAWLCSCGSTSTSSISGPSSAKCQVGVNGGNMSFPPQGGNGSVQVSANRDCVWSAQATAGWIHLGAASGQGDGTIPFSVDSNPQTSSRDGAIEVSNAGQVAVSQAAQPPAPPPPISPVPDPAPGPAPPPGPEPPGDAGQSIDLDGEVSLLLGVCPDLTFTVSRRLVQTNADTEFKGMKCSDMRNGRKVKVKGVVRSDGIVMATEVKKA